MALQAACFIRIRRRMVYLMIPNPCVSFQLKDSLVIFLTRMKMKLYFYTYNFLPEN